jgi:hypothetical protein
MSVRPLAALALGAALLGGCAAHRASNDGEGAVLVVGKAATDYFCAPDAKTADRIATTIAQADEDAYRDAIYNSLAVQPGTHVREVRRVSGEEAKVEVMVEQGLYSGHTCWYPATVKGLLRPAT